MTMSTIRVADLIGKDVSSIRGDVRGGRYPESGSLVRTLVKCERKRKTEYKSQGKQWWIYLHWKPEPRTDGGRDCGYSGWEEGRFKELDPVIIVEGN